MGDLVVFFFPLQQVECQCFEHSPALVEGQAAQGGVAGFATVFEDGGVVQAFAVGGADEFSGDGVVLGDAVAGAGRPLAEDVVLKLLHGGDG